MLYSDVIASYPNAKPLVDFILVDELDGKGPQLTFWNTALGPAPGPATAAQVLAYTQAAQIALINAACQGVLAAVVAAYPEHEVSTWPQQYAEAQAYTANNAASTPMLSAIAAASSSTVSLLASGVMVKAAAYQAASGAAIGKRLLLTSRIQAATTVAAVQAIVW